MRTSRSRSLLAALVSWGCYAEDQVPCSEYEITPTVAIEWNSSPNDLTSRPINTSVKLNGNVDATVRIDRLYVGDQLTTGIRANYSDWTIDIPLTTLQGIRQGDMAEMDVVAHDVCGGQHLAEEPLRVRVIAPSGTPASGLELDVVAVQRIPGAPEGDGRECYLPIDGSGEAKLEISADSSAVGVTVALRSMVAGELSGTTDGTVVLVYDEQADRAVGPANVYFRPTAAGLINVSASAGPEYDTDESTRGLKAVAAPTFSGASGVIPLDARVSVTIRTNGRLASCRAASPQPGFVVVRASGIDLLSEELMLGSDTTCGQEQEITVRYELTAPLGLAMELECSDTYGQSSKHTIMAGE